MERNLDYQAICGNLNSYKFIITNYMGPGLARLDLVLPTSDWPVRPGEESSSNQSQFG